MVKDRKQEICKLTVLPVVVNLFEIQRTIYKQKDEGELNWSRMAFI